MKPTEEKSIADTKAEEEFFLEDKEEDNRGTTFDAQAVKREEKRLFRAGFSAAVVLLLGIIAIYWLRDDIVFFFSSTEPIEMGRAEDLTEVGPLHNRFVSIEGIARDMCIRAEMFSAQVRFMYLLGSDMGRRIVVQSLAPKKEKGCLGALQKVFTGRLVDLSRTSRYEKVLSYYRKHFPAAPKQGRVFVLIDGEKPYGSWWVPSIIVMVLLIWGISLTTLLRRYAKQGADKALITGLDGGV